MANSFELDVVKFLLGMERVTVADVAEATELSAEFRIPLLAAMLRSQIIQPKELTLASEAVHALTKREVSYDKAVEIYQVALQRGLTFSEVHSQKAPAPAAVSADPEQTRIGSLLVAAKVISEHQLQSALNMCAWRDMYIGQALVEAKAISGELLGKALQVQSKLRVGVFNFQQAVYALQLEPVRATA